MSRSDTPTTATTADPGPGTPRERGSGLDLVVIRQMVDERVLAATARANRRARALGWFAVVMALVALGASAGLAYYTYYYGLPGITSPSIRAREVVLVDRDGAERGYWRIDDEGTARLSMADPDGAERIRLSVRTDGEQALALADDDGAARVALALLNDNSANLAFADARGQTRSVLGLSAAGASSLLFTDQAGGARAALGIAADGSPTFWWPELDGEPGGEGP